MNKKLLLLIIICSNFTSGSSQVALPPNLIRNSYMNILNGNGVPAGYSTRGNVQIQAVHPFTKGFEGPYLPASPASAVSDVNDATEANPYYYGVYNKGARTIRGGLGDGFGSLADGRILKITGNNTAGTSSVTFPFERNVKTATVHFRCWIKIVTGSQVGFGIDAGQYPTAWGEKIVTKSTTDAAPDGWYYINETVLTTSVTDLTGNPFMMTVKADDPSSASSTFEAYIALPQMYIEAADAWVPSISDVLSRDGLTLHPETNNVGIGTKLPQAPLHISSTYPRVMLSDALLTLGLASEVEGRLIDYGTNYPQLGLYNGSYRGGYFRIDTRDNYTHEFFNVKHIPAGSGPQTIFSLNTAGTGKFASRLVVNGGVNESPLYNDDGITELQVNGTIASKKIKVTQTGWSDYVFEPDYKLASLDSVENYIRKHKHLPEIISAKEVDAKGLDLGENQAALLKKIEELTLHLIQLKKDFKLKTAEQDKKIQLLEKAKGSKK